MLNITQLQDALTGIVGLNLGINIVPSRLLVDARYRKPSLFLSDAHKLLRTDVLTSLGPNLLQAQPPFYNSNNTYQKYDIVTANSKHYESLVADNDAEVTDTAKWRETTLLSAWFGALERGAIAKLALACAGNPAAVPVVDRMPLYQREGNVQQTINKLGRFCGLRIFIKKADIMLGLLSVGLQLSGPVTDLPMYLFRSDQAQPVKVAELTTTTSGRMSWLSIGEYLYNSGADYYLEGEYYLIGYFEDDLPSGVFAVSGERNLSRLSGCSGCQPYDYEVHKSRDPYVTIEAVTVSDPGDSRTLNWPLEEVSQLQTFGLNLLIEIQPNATASLLQHKDMLTNALLHFMACDALEEMAFSDRVNAVNKELRPQAYVALNGQGKSDTDTGLKADRNRILSDLKKQLAKVAPRSLPAEPVQKTISFESIW